MELQHIQYEIILKGTIDFILKSPSMELQHIH